MTTIPNVRPGAPLAARPAHVASVPSAAPAIDPIKLVKKHKWTLLAAAVAGAVIGTIVHYIMLYTYPIYSPFAVYQCQPVQTEIGVGAPAMIFKDELEKFMATQVQLLTSDRIIDKTLSDPNFTKEAQKWSRPYMRNGVLDTDRAARALRRNLSAGVLGESSLIRVSFWWTDRQDATAIVRLLCRTYQNDRRLIATGESAERSDLLSRSISETTDAIKRQQENRARLLQDQNVDALEQANSSALANIRNLDETIVKNRADMESLMSRQRQMEAELASPTGQTYSNDIRQRAEEDPNLLRIKDEVNLYQAELFAAQKRLGPQHPTIRRLETTLEGKRQNLQGEKERLLRQYFDAQLDTIRSSVASLQATEDNLLKKLTDAKTRAAELTQTIAKVHDIDHEVDRLTESRNKLGDDLKQYTILSQGINQSRIQLVQDAQAPKTVSFPKLYVMIPAGIFIGMGLVVGAIVFLEVVDQRVKGAADIAMIPRTRILGLIPHASEDPAAPQKVETVFRDQPAGVMAESYRQLRSAVLKRMREGHLKTLLVMSGMPASGATSVVCNLGQAMAGADLKVLIIDANLRRPAIHRVLGLAETPGLSDVLAGTKTFAETVQRTENPSMNVLTAGSVNTRLVERLGTAPMADLLTKAAAEFDIVLVDVAPAQIAGDALSLASRCDATMLVVRAFGEKRGMVARLRNELGESRAEFLGVVVNAVRSLAGGYLKGNILAAHQYQNGRGSGKD